MSEEDRELDRRWRERFNQPLPILGAAALVRTILDRRAPPDRSGDRAARR